MIPWEDYVPDAPTEVGEQVSINHTACPAGADTRGRLYIKREKEELIIAYCHNCADKGYYIQGYSNVDSYRHKQQPIATPTITHKVRLPSGLAWDEKRWPQEARTWAMAHLNPKELEEMGIAYHPGKERVILPFCSYSDLGILGYQSRRVMPKDPRPKYLTEICWVGGSKFYEPFTIDVKRVKRFEDTIAVVCEDMISAFKLYKAGYSAYCLCGSHFNIGEFYRDQQKYLPNLKGVFVWLDNDNREIKDLAQRIAKVTQLTYPEFNVVVSGSIVEPKAWKWSEDFGIPGALSL